MNPSQAAELLGYCAAFDNRTVGTVDARAWAAALHDVPLDADALAAVARFYGTPPDKPGERLWIKPYDVRAGRLAIRKGRLGETLPAYQAPAELETGSEFIARRRAQLDAVASGRITGKPVGQLTGGPAPAVAAELDRRFGTIGRTIPDANADEEVAAIRRAGPLGVECPVCTAPIGHRCRIGTPGDDRRPRELSRPHPARARVANGEPAAIETAEDIERRRTAYLARLEQMAANEAAHS